MSKVIYYSQLSNHYLTLIFVSMFLYYTVFKMTVDINCYAD